MSPLSGVLSEAWALYRRHASHFILISFAIYLVIAVINALLSWGLGSVGSSIGLIFSLFGAFLLQAALVKAVPAAARRWTASAIKRGLRDHAGIPGAWPPSALPGQ
jgi:hypothetical protein